jgi:hypothetical protein
MSLFCGCSVPALKQIIADNALVASYGWLRIPPARVLLMKGLEVVKRCMHSLARNVRELQNIIEQTIILKHDEVWPANQLLEKISMEVWYVEV